jgi:hypothetical protein
MWQETREFNLGKMTKFCSREAMERAKSQKFLANLRDADVCVLGADSPGRKRVNGSVKSTLG